MPVKPDRAPLADRPAHAGTALLVIDMISTWDFVDADKIVRGGASPSRRASAP